MFALAEFVLQLEPKGLERVLDCRSRPWRHVEFVVGLGPWWMKSSALFANTFVLHSEIDSLAPLWVGVATGLAAWICVVTGAMTLRLAHVRFGMPAVGVLGVPGIDGEPSTSATRWRWAEIGLALLIAAGTGVALWQCNGSPMGSGGSSAGSRRCLRR